MLVRVLGAVELVASDGAAVSLPGTRQAALLAALVSRKTEVVSTDRLVTLLWADELPDNPEAALHSTVFKLRASLRAAGGRDVLLTRDRGYQLVLEAGDLDADVFTRLVADAGQEPPPEAADSLAQALALWRGRAYGAFADSDIAQLESLRLEEARRMAVEQRAEALLASGKPTDAITLLDPFVAENPLREAARGRLMRALHESGRTAEALEHYHGYRVHLAEELGLEPSHAMQSLQVEVLQPPAQRQPDDPAPRTPARARQGGPPRGLPGLAVRYLRMPSGSVIAYGTSGSGLPMVVILGWVSSLEVIASGRDPRSSLLERLTNRMSLTLYDRTGTGLSPGPVLDFGLEASVEEIEEVVAEVGPPVSLLAMSAAGPIAVALAARRPSWVSSLVLFGTFANAHATFTHHDLRDLLVKIARTHWGMGSKLLADLYRPGASDQAAWHLAQVLRDSASPEVAAEYLAATYELDVEGLLPSVRAPALVLHYRGDRLIPFRGAQDLVAGLPDATLVPLDGKVHLPDAADLDLIEQAIVDHVQRHASEAGTVHAR